MVERVREIVPTSWRTDPITAWKSQIPSASVDMLRFARIIDHDKSLGVDYCLAKEWCATPGLDPKTDQTRVLERDWLASDGKDSNGRRAVVDFRRLSVDFAGLGVPLTTFIPEKIVLTESEILITPIPETIIPSPKAPSKSAWCKLESGVFEEVRGTETVKYSDVLKELRNNHPLLAAYPWINERANVGPMHVYNDAGGQALTAGYYRADFNGRFVSVEGAPLSKRAARRLDSLIRRGQITESEADYILGIHNSVPLNDAF